MDRLQSELQRLYLPTAACAGGAVRAMVLEIAGPTAWQELAPLWEAVQVEFGLPAPAIAVNGVDGYQAWFSLAQPVAAEQAEGFLSALRARYLAGVAPERVRAQQASALPPAQPGPGRWSSFVAPDLAPLFAEEPWLDQPPGRDAQADLLSRIASAKPEAFERACARLAGPPAAAAVEHHPAAPAAETDDPRSFLLSVMRDPAVDLRLRIEAAKALLR